MKILKKITQLKSSKICSFAKSWTNLTGVCALALSGYAIAQTDKQISYPVPVHVERTAVSSAAAAPVYKAPTPVIRPIEEASNTPAPVRKKATSTATEKKAKQTTTQKKPAQKKSSTSTAKKSTTTATSKTTPNKKPATNKKVTTAAPVVTKPKPQTAVASASSSVTAKPTSEAVAPAMLSPTKKMSNDTTPSTATKMAVAPVAAAALATSDLAHTNELTEGTVDDEDFSLSQSFDDEATSPTPTVAATAAKVKDSSLSVGGPREKFVQEFKQYVETKLVPRVPGLAVAIIADGKVKVLEAYGVKRVGTSDPIDVNTAFRLASVSKTIAGTTAGVLVNDGLIKWDTPITSVLPDVQFSNPRYGNQLTLRNIMSQSTGLPTHAGDNFIEQGLPFNEVLDKFRAVNFVCPPGKCYSYQNVTMSLLANIVLKKTGKPYEQYVKEKLFNPLGMRSASIGLEGLLATKNYAQPHEMTGRGKWYTKEITQHYYRLNPAAGGNASISDMARWVLAHMGHNPDVLPPATLRAVHAKVTKNTAAQSHYGAREGVTDTHYGMGWRTFDYRGDKNFLHHGGYVFGSRSEMVFNPELQIGMVILSNCNRLPGSVVFEFLDAYEDEKRGEVRPSAKPAKKKAKAK